MPLRPTAKLLPAVKPAPRAPGLAEQARVVLEEKIVTLELEPGSMWSEGELASLTGFGRTPVREALKRLESHHLVRIMQRHGVQIVEIDAGQQLQLLETRRELERLVATRAARRRDLVAAAKCADFARALREAGRRGDVLAFMRLHADAEEVVLAACGNRFAAAAIAPFYALSRRFYVLHHRTAKDLRLACEYHAKTLMAICDGDERAAAAAADAVLDYVEGFTRATLSDRF